MNVYEPHFLLTPYHMTVFRLVHIAAILQKEEVMASERDAKAIMLLSLFQMANFIPFQTERVCRRQFQI